ncbi:MAG: hypothetical protein GPJ54_02670 [Candidatus Heimdallarchaeota archaeon]|nr:hypothetical protein [Candidatus Heimdallarchaeota archaeon]
MNQFVKIDHATGETDWIAGWNGDFELFNADGIKVKHLWYTPHDVRYVGDGEFVMFDNGNGNVTSIQNNDPESQRSSILHIRIDEKSMEIHEVFRWTAPKQYYSFHWGSASLLPNGNYLGGFGSNYHQWNRSLPAYHEDFGGVAIEVTPEGEVVWEMRVPYNWGFFRVYRYVAESFDKFNPSPVIIAFAGVAIITVVLLLIKKKSVIG